MGFQTENNVSEQIYPENAHLKIIDGHYVAANEVLILDPGEVDPAAQGKKPRPVMTAIHLH